MILVDSSVWIAHLRDSDTASVRKLRAIDPPDQILVGDLILLEVLQGARDEPHAARIERNLRQFAIVPLLGDDLRCVQRSATAPCARGVTVRKTIDLIIATFCIDQGSAFHRPRILP